jgi:hypothetical protein
MTSIFFLFTREHSLPPRRDWILDVVRRYVRRTLATPGLILWIALPILLVLFALALLPQLPLIFDASTRSMEPKSMKLTALGGRRKCRRAGASPGMVRAPNEEQLHEAWQKIDGHWRELERTRKIKYISTPAALALSPNLMEANRRRLGSIDFAVARRALDEAIAREGFSRESFAAGFKLLDQLEAVGNGRMAIPDWRKALPPSSSWWFLVNRYFAADPLLTVGFVTTNQPVEKLEQKEMPMRELPSQVCHDPLRLEFSH